MKTADLNWNLPYRSARDPVFARNVVATSQPLATQAGIEIMRSGGNAIDAALATAIALTVVEPCSNGVGSDAFAQIWDGSTLHGLNASGRSPKKWNRERFAKYSTMPTIGWDTVTVPGAVSAWVALSDRFGQLDFEQLFQPAIRYARDGFHLGRRTAALWLHAAERYQAFDGFRQHFLVDGHAPSTGEVFRRPELAVTLERIAESHGEEIYRGSLAETIVAQANAEGGVMSVADLREHSCEWVQPVSQPYNGLEVHELPPNGQGLGALIALAIIERLNVCDYEPGSTPWVHLQVEAMKVAIRAAFDHFADPASMVVSPEELLDPTAVQKLAKDISPRTAAKVPSCIPVHPDTVYLATADEDGRMVSMIQSNYMGFGSGLVIEGTGIAMQNRGSGFTLEHDHPNEVAGGKRPFHTIIPGFVTRGGKPELAFGVMGGHMQHQGHVQMVTRIFDHGENPQAASDAPRWYVRPDNSLVLEFGYSDQVASELEQMGHTVESGANVNLFGGAQLIGKLEEGYCAASDHRKEGMAAGF